MDEKELKSLMETAAPPVDEQKRRDTLAMAMQSFDEGVAENNFQGSDENVRPTDNVTRIRRRLTMSTTTTRPWTTGFAAAAGLALAVNLVLFQPELFNRTSGTLPDSSHYEPHVFREGQSEVLSEGSKEGESTPATVADVAAVTDVMAVPEMRSQQLGADDAVAAKRSKPQPFSNAGNATASQPAAAMRSDISQLNARMAPLAEMATSASGGQHIAFEPVVASEAQLYREGFTEFADNPVHRVSDQPVSTFSIDVDTASYSVVRRMLNRGTLPPADAVRVEELVNYFDYQYALPDSTEPPFAPTVTVLDAPWQPGNKLVHIGIRGYDLSAEDMPRSNLVFLLDVSGSMNNPDKLPLVKQSLAMLLDQLRPDDTVAIAVYAGAAGTVLPPTPAAEKRKILDAMQRLSAGGSTAGGAGIRLAYQLAQSALIEDGVNRVILATDGDFNVGITNNRELQDFVERQRKSGVFLSVLGFGEGNYQDARMQALAQNGNGVAAYIDTVGEAQKVLVEEATSTLFTIAKDVKIQVEFNPATVSEYRLIGYETRALKREDFRNDAVDAGDIGAGHTVTAIYEITPIGGNGLIAPDRYGSRPASADEVRPSEYGFLKLRYKQPDTDRSELIETAIPLHSPANPLQQSEANFAVAVAAFGQLLRNSPYMGEWQLQDVLTLALNNRGEDLYGYRAEFTQLVRKAIAADAMR